ncbi:unnamed protein product, partial [Discosporangium mesarthrocarpum]
MGGVGHRGPKIGGRPGVPFSRERKEQQQAHACEARLFATIEGVRATVARAVGWRRRQAILARQEKAREINLHANHAAERGRERARDQLRLRAPPPHPRAHSEDPTDSKVRAQRRGRVRGGLVGDVKGRARVYRGFSDGERGSGSERDEDEWAKGMGAGRESQDRRKINGVRKRGSWVGGRQASGRGGEHARGRGRSKVGGVGGEQQREEKNLETSDTD